MDALSTSTAIAAFVDLRTPRLRYNPGSMTDERDRLDEPRASDSGAAKMIGGIAGQIAPTRSG